MGKRGVVLTLLLLLISLGCMGRGTGNSHVSTTGVKEAVEIARESPGYYPQATYESDCAKRPEGSICLSFSDDYVWLVYDTILSSKHAFPGVTSGPPSADLRLIDIVLPHL